MWSISYPGHTGSKFCITYNFRIINQSKLSIPSLLVTYHIDLCSFWRRQQCFCLTSLWHLSDQNILFLQIDLAPTLSTRIDGSRWHFSNWVDNTGKADHVISITDRETGFSVYWLVSVSIHSRVAFYYEMMSGYQLLSTRTSTKAPKSYWADSASA